MPIRGERADLIEVDEAAFIDPEMLEGEEPDPIYDYQIPKEE